MRKHYVEQVDRGELMESVGFLASALTTDVFVVPESQGMWCRCVNYDTVYALMIGLQHIGCRGGARKVNGIHPFAAMYTLNMMVVHPVSVRGMFFTLAHQAKVES